jgi:hypothetical protein
MYADMRTLADMMYLVRVELHGANRADYDVLHETMSRRGFQRTIRSNTGADYALPTAEYVADTYQSGEEVRGVADAAASETGRNRAVLVVRYDQSWWTGLQFAS